jgi:hypothetical protein
MTCEEFRRITTTSEPWKHTRATIAAVAKHGLECHECGETLNQAGLEILQEDGIEEIERLEAIHEQEMAKLGNWDDDPEVREIADTVSEEDRDHWTAGRYKFEVLKALSRRPKGECDGSS